MTKNKQMFELGLKENYKRVIIKSPTKIEQMYGTGGLHMTEDEYKIQINEMVNAIKEIKILRRIYLFIVTIIGSFH